MLCACSAFLLAAFICRQHRSGASTSSLPLCAHASSASSRARTWIVNKPLLDPLERHSRCLLTHFASTNRQDHCWDKSGRYTQGMRVHLKPITLLPICAGNGAYILQTTCVVVVPAVANPLRSKDASRATPVNDPRQKRRLWSLPPRAEMPAIKSVMVTSRRPTSSRPSSMCNRSCACRQLRHRLRSSPPTFSMPSCVPEPCR